MADLNLRYLFGHLLWILAAASVLSAFSYYSWRAGVDRRPVRDFLRTCPSWRRSLVWGLLVTASGFLMLPGTHWLEAAAWLAVWLGAASNLQPLRSRS